MRPPMLVLCMLMLVGAAASSAGGARQDHTLELLSLLPRHSPTDRRDVLAIEAGIDAVLDANDHRAGGHSIRLVKGSSSDPDLGNEVFYKCIDIGTRYAADRGVIAAIGPLTDACATNIVPAFSQAGIPLISTTVSAPVFTHNPRDRAGICPVGSHTRHYLDGCRPRHFYPGGRRNFAHVAATIDYQGPAAAAVFAQRRAKRIYVMALYGNDSWMAGPFRRQARRLGLRIVGLGRPTAPRPSASSIRRHARAVLRSRAQGLYFVGSEGDPVGRDVGLAPYLRAVRKAGFRGTIVGSFWHTHGLLAQRAPRAAEGMYYTSTRLPLAALPAEASALARRLRLEGRDAVNAAYGAAAATVLLRAIASSDGSRAGVRAALFRFRGRTVVGEFRIDANGDVVPARIAISQVVRGSLRYRATLTVAR
jgi:ABC-type branched-subunit amino acid transport system substrate-binding protein